MGLTAKVKQEYDLRGSLPRPLVYIQMGLLGAFFRGRAGDFNDCGVELVVVFHPKKNSSGLSTELSF